MFFVKVDAQQKSRLRLTNRDIGSDSYGQTIDLDVEVKGQNNSFGGFTVPKIERYDPAADIDNSYLQGINYGRQAKGRRNYWNNPIRTDYIHSLDDLLDAERWQDALEKILWMIKNHPEFINDNDIQKLIALNYRLKNYETCCKYSAYTTATGKLAEMLNFYCNGSNLSAKGKKSIKNEVKKEANKIYGEKVDLFGELKKQNKFREAGNVLKETYKSISNIKNIDEEEIGNLNQTIGEGYYMINEFEASILHSKIAISLNNQFGRAYGVIGASYQKLGERDNESSYFDESCKYLKQALQMKEGLPSEYIENFKKIMEKSCNRLNSPSSRGDKDSAIEELKKLKELLELELITQDEFDKKSDELKKIILGTSN